MHEIDPRSSPDSIEDRVEWLAYVVSNFCAMLMVYQAHGVTNMSEVNHEYIEYEVEVQRESMMPAMRRRAEAWVSHLDDTFFTNARQPN